MTAECPCGGKGWMWCPECRRVDAARLYTGIAKNCRNHRPVPTCPTCLPVADGQATLDLGASA